MKPIEKVVILQDLKVSKVVFIYLLIATHFRIGRNSEVCENLPTKSENLCALRQYLLLDGEDYDKYAQCVFESFQYIDANTIQVDKIKKDFGESNNLDETTENDITTCFDYVQRNSSMNNKSSAFLRCMVYSDSFEKFKRILDLRKIGGEACKTNKCDTDNEDEYIPTFTPDDSSFVFTRCSLLHPKQTRILEKDISKSSDECFVKCILEKLHLYNPSTRSFMFSVINSQFGDYGDYLSINEKQVEALETGCRKLSLTEGSCNEVHTKFFESLSSHTGTLGLLFHFPKFSEEINKKKIPHLKTPGISYLVFCAEHTLPEKQICPDHSLTGLIKTNQQNPDEAVKNFASCVSQGFKYLNPAYAIDAGEIRRDFRLTGALDEQSAKDIHTCSVEADQLCSIDRAHYVLLCLMNSPSARKLEAVLEYKEFVSANYTAELTQQSYNRDVIKQQLKQNSEYRSKTCK